MTAEPEPCADLSDRPSVETSCFLTAGEFERFATCLLPSAPLTFEQAFDLYAPPVHVPEPLDDPEHEPAFLRAEAFRPPIDGSSLFQ